MNYRCSACGFECEKEEELIAHCNKDHKHDPNLLFNMIGKFGSLEHATMAFNMMLSDYLTMTGRVEQLMKENKQQKAELSRYAAAINIYNEAASGVSRTMKLFRLH
jgi:hypothetical protein